MKWMQKCGETESTEKLFHLDSGEMIRLASRNSGGGGSQEKLCFRAQREPRC